MEATVSLPVLGEPFDVPIPESSHPAVTLTVVDRTTPGTFTVEQLTNLVWSLRYQALFHYNRSPWVERDYSAPVADVRLISPDLTPPSGSWHMELLDTSDQEGALGYHEDQAFDLNSPGPKKASGRSSRGIALHPVSGELIPLAKVFCKTSREDGVQPSEVASHEMLKMLVDPQVVNEAQIRKYLNPATKQWYIGEVADLAQGRGYDVGAAEGRPCGVPEATVADAGYPGWWGQPQTRTPTTMAEEFGLAPRLEPFEIAPGAYMSVAPETEPSNWTQINGQAQATPAPSSTSATPAEGHVSNRQLLELLHNIDQRISNMEDVLAGLAADEAELATIVPKLIERDEAASKKLGEFEAKSAAGEVVPRAEVETLKSGFDQSVASLKTLLPAEPAAPTTEDVTVSVGESGEGSATIQHAPASVSIAQQPSSGTASIEAVEGQPDQASVKVRNSTPSTSQVVTVSITPAA